MLRALRIGWGQSLLSGAMLAQIGEFSFVLAAVGREVGIIGGYGYQLTVGLIALLLLPAMAVQGQETPLDLKALLELAETRNPGKGRRPR